MASVFDAFHAPGDRDNKGSPGSPCGSEAHESPPLSQHPYPPFEVRAVSGQGYAAFATRSYSPGEVVYSEAPLLIMPLPQQKDGEGEGHTKAATSGALYTDEQVAALLAMVRAV